MVYLVLVRSVTDGVSDYLSASVLYTCVSMLTDIHCQRGRRLTWPACKAIPDLESVCRQIKLKSKPHKNGMIFLHTHITHYSHVYSY